MVRIEFTDEEIEKLCYESFHYPHPRVQQKMEALYSKYYADFAVFSEAISNCISLAHTKHKRELDSLLTLRFQTFDQPQLGAAEFPALASA